MEKDRIVKILQAALAALDSGRLGDARRICSEALKSDPGYPDSQAVMGMVAHKEKKYAEAAEHYRTAIALNPKKASYYSNLGTALEESGKEEEALRFYNEAIKKEPASPKYNLNPHKPLCRLNRIAEAEICARKALSLDNKYLKAYVALADILQIQGKTGEAEKCYDQLAAALPGNPDVDYNRAFFLLRQGKLLDGFSAYQARWKKSDIPNRAAKFVLPEWNGENASDKTLLLWGEQGVGDEIMCAGMIDELAKKCGRLIVETTDRLVPLFARSFSANNIDFIARENPPLKEAKTADMQIPMLTLPLYLRPEFDCFPARQSYLKPDKVLLSRLKSEYKSLGKGLKIGVSWYTGAQGVGIDRTIPLPLWQDLLKTPGTVFYSLQYGDHKKEIAEFSQKTGCRLIVDEEMNALENMDDFAAQVAAMDLVISIDNSTAHLAAALGKPTWLLLHALPDWRWMTGREDSPWYPTIKLFRQTENGDWSGAMSRVKAALLESIEQH